MHPSILFAKLLTTKGIVVATTTVALSTGTAAAATGQLAPLRAAHEQTTGTTSPSPEAVEVTLAALEGDVSSTTEPGPEDTTTTSEQTTTTLDETTTTLDETTTTTAGEVTTTTAADPEPEVTTTTAHPADAGDEGSTDGDAHPDNHGGDVSAVAHDDSLTGRAKGQAVSDAAHNRDDARTPTGDETPEETGPAGGAKGRGHS